MEVVLIFVFMYSDELVTFGIINQLIETVKQFNETIQKLGEMIQKQGDIIKNHKDRFGKLEGNLSQHGRKVQTLNEAPLQI